MQEELMELEEMSKKVNLIKLTFPMEEQSLLVKENEELKQMIQIVAKMKKKKRLKRKRKKEKEGENKKSVTNKKSDEEAQEKEEEEEEERIFGRDVWGRKLRIGNTSSRASSSLLGTGGGGYSFTGNWEHLGASSRRGGRKSSTSSASDLRRQVLLRNHLKSASTSPYQPLDMRTQSILEQQASEDEEMRSVKGDEENRLESDPMDWMPSQQKKKVLAKLVQRRLSELQGGTVLSKNRKREIERDDTDTERGGKRKAKVSIEGLPKGRSEKDRDIERKLIHEIRESNKNLKKNEAAKKFLRRTKEDILNGVGPIEEENISSSELRKKIIENKKDFSPNVKKHNKKRFELSPLPEEEEDEMECEFDEGKETPILAPRPGKRKGSVVTAQRFSPYARKSISTRPTLTAKRRLDSNLNTMLNKYISGVKSHLKPSHNKKQDLIKRKIAETEVDEFLDACCGGKRVSYKRSNEENQNVGGKRAAYFPEVSSRAQHMIHKRPYEDDEDLNDCFDYEPRSKIKNTANAKVRHVGVFAGKKRKRDEEEDDELLTNIPYKSRFVHDSE